MDVVYQHCDCRQHIRYAEGNFSPNAGSPRTWPTGLAPVAAFDPLRLDGPLTADDPHEVEHWFTHSSEDPLEGRGCPELVKDAPRGPQQYRVRRPTVVSTGVSVGPFSRPHPAKDSAVFGWSAACVSLPLGMWVRLTRKLAELLEGVDLSNRRVGDAFEVPDRQGRLLIAEGWAEAHVANNLPDDAREPFDVMLDRLRRVREMMDLRIGTPQHRRRAEDLIRD